MVKASTPKKAGFTLLEILVAMAIFAIVLSTIYSVFTKTLTEMKEIEFEAEIYQTAWIALERIQEDLECAFLSNKEEETSEEETNTPGTIEFEGKNEEIDGRDADSLMFFSTRHISLDQEDEFSGLTRISYYVKENEDEEGLTLYRSDRPEYESASEEETDGLILCDNLFSVKFTYYAAEGDERDEWNSSEEKSKGKLPAIVAIRLSFIDERSPEEPLLFETGVALPMARDKYGKGT